MKIFLLHVSLPPHLSCCCILGSKYGRKRKLLIEWWTESHNNRGMEKATATWTSSLTKQKLLTKWIRRKEMEMSYTFSLSLTHTQKLQLFLFRNKIFWPNYPCRSLLYFAILYLRIVSSSPVLPFMFSQLLSISFYSPLTELDLINLYGNGKTNII